jgi:multiple sugar transport system substrate-binding protein
MTLPRTSRRTVLVGASAATALTTLAACGRSDAEDGSAPQSTVSEGPATGTLEFWAGSPDGDTLPDFIADFKSANPDLTVNITTVPSDDFDTKLTAAIAAGNVPDMVMLYSQTQSSILATGSFATVPDGVVDTGSFFAPAMDGVTIGGDVKAVPWYAYAQVVYYR